MGFFHILIKHFYFRDKCNSIDDTLSQHSLYLLKLLHHLSQFYGPKSICFRNALQDEWKKPLTFAFDKCFPHWNQPGNEGDAKLAQKTWLVKEVDILKSQV